LKINETDDKQIEHDRYNDRANDLLNLKRVEGLPPSGSKCFPDYLRVPYVYFESVLKEKLNADHKVLEIGAGTGHHTEVLVESGASVIATDISDNSRLVLQKRLKYSSGIDVSIKVADMENLPFKDNFFDFVVSAGSLSYGNNDRVRNEVYRLLKCGGEFICIDSLNRNIFYILNRWIHFLRGTRTKSTLQRMPLLSLIENYEQKFGNCKAEFFGSIVWASPIL